MWYFSYIHKEQSLQNIKKSFEHTKGVIRIRISKKDRQHNGQKKKRQKDRQQSTKHTHKAKDRVIRTPLKTGGELMCPGGVCSACFTNYKSGDKSSMRKAPGSVCDKWNISVVIYYTDIP